MTLRDVFPRIIAISESLEVGDVAEARAIVSDLENDLARELGADRRAFACSCGLSFRWPGERERHLVVSGHGLEQVAA